MDHQQVLSGRVKYPPTLGFTKTPEGMVGRLANTLETDRGAVTILFTGERAEIADRILRAGGQLDVKGSFDPYEPESFHVDRFDVPGAGQTHSYGLAQQQVEQQIVALDTSGASEAAPLATVTSLVDRRSPDPDATKPDGTHLPEATEASSSGEKLAYSVGERVRALDRGNLGTVASIHEENDEPVYMVKFVSAAGREAVRPFRAEAIEAVASRRPSADTSRTPSDVDQAPTTNEGRDWSFASTPSGAVRLRFPPPVHEIAIRDRGERALDHDVARWEAEIRWADKGQPRVNWIYDDSRTQLVDRALEELAGLASFEPHRRNPKWASLLHGSGAEGASQEPAEQARPDPSPPPEVSRRSAVHESVAEPGHQAPGEAGRSQHAVAQAAPPAVVARPRLRALPIHTRTVDPDTGAITL